MSARPLPGERVDQLRGAELTYPEVGATATTVPPGYRFVRRRRVLQRRDFRAVAEDLLYYRVHEAAGVEVAASSPRVDAGEVVELRLGRGPAVVTAPCRVVSVVEEANRRGFTYGTLPGHPECGEELFLLEQHDDGSLSFSVTAFSRPATLPARVGGPVTGWIQDRVTARYLAAPDRLAPPAEQPS